MGDKEIRMTLSVRLDILKSVYVSHFLPSLLFWHSDAVLKEGVHSINAPLKEQPCRPRGKRSFAVGASFFN
jgi:hypothetical protein